jgi:DNA repair protein RAD16
VTQGTVVNNYAHIFDLLIRLRQAVNHPWLVEYSATRMLSLEQQNSESDDEGAEGASSAAAAKPAAA